MFVYPCVPIGTILGYFAYYIKLYDINNRIWSEYRWPNITIMEKNQNTADIRLFVSHIPTISKTVSLFSFYTYELYRFPRWILLLLKF